MDATVALPGTLLASSHSAFRPAVWGHADERIKQHARKPNEVLADAIGSVYLGLSDVQLLEPMMQGTGTTLIDLGLADRAAMPIERPGRPEAVSLPAVDTKRAVIDVETKAEIEAHEAKTDDEAQ